MDGRIEFKMPALINDWHTTKTTRNKKELYDTYLSSRPASNREANADRSVTSVRHVVESVNKSLKRFKLLRHTFKVRFQNPSITTSKFQILQNI